jgi:hypothetical protein
VSGAAPAVVTVLARAPTGNRLAAGYSDGAVREQRCGGAAARPLRMRQAAAAPRRLAEDARAPPPPVPRQIRIWNLSSGECNTTLHGHKVRRARARGGALPCPPPARSAVATLARRARSRHRAASRDKANLKF